MDGEVQFESRPTSTSSRINSNSKSNEIVPSICLNTLMTKIVKCNVDLMKIDIEGAEETFLSGRESLLKDIDHLVIEIHPNYCNAESVINTLRNSYKFIYIITGRRSSKPLLLASCHQYNLPNY